MKLLKLLRCRMRMVSNFMGGSASLMALMALFAAPVDAATITVTSASDPSDVSLCTLRDAINSMNNNADLGNCVNTGGAYGTNNTVNFASTLDGATITVAGQHFQVFNTTSPLLIDGANQITISGGPAPTAQTNRHILNVAPGAALELRALTIQNGFNANSGGAIINLGALTITNCTFSGNETLGSGGAISHQTASPLTISGSSFTGNYADSRGGVISISSGSPTITNSSFTNNSSLLAGGGIHITSNASAIVTSSTFTANSASSGGDGGAISNLGSLSVANTSFTSNTQSAIFNGATGTANITLASTFTNNTSPTFNGGAIQNNGSLTVSDSTFTNNFATSSGSDGGAIFSIGTAQVSVSRSTFSGNQADHQGGAIAIFSGTLQVTNSTFASNSANDGGAIAHNTASPATLIYNSTFWHNLTAQANSGAISGSGAGSYNLYNTILDNPPSGPAQGGNCSAQAPFDGGGNLSTDGSCAFGATSQQDVAFSGLDTNGLANNGGSTQTIKLLTGSAAIDRGINDNVPAGVTTDQRGTGNFRAFGASVDVGAYELKPSSGTFTYYAVLDGSQVVPPTNSPATGTSIITYNYANRSLRLQFDFSGLTGDSTQVHLHGGAKAGSNASGSAIRTIFTNGTSFTYDNTTTPVPDLQAFYLAQGTLYIDVHSTMFPVTTPGEIRGQYAAVPAAVCGNGDVELGEQCDPPGSGSACSLCDQNCRFPAAGTSCASDNQICTVDQCDGDGACVHLPGNENQVCRPASGVCDAAERCTGSSPDCPSVDVKRPQGFSCTDNNACTSDQCDGSSVDCQGTPINTDDASVCTADTCDSVTGVLHTPISCDDGNACTSDSCNATTGCFSTPITCDDNNPGTQNTCVPATGCSYPPIFNYITATSGANGTVTPSGSTAVQYGGSQSYSITPASGYNIQNVLVDGVSVGTPATYQFTNVTANHTISATFSAIVVAGPVVTSQNFANFRVGVANNFQVTSNPPATKYTITGKLPSGVTFNTTTGKLSGNPNLLQLGVYSLKITPYNGTVAGTPQTFTLKVQDFGLIGIPLVSEIKQGKTGTFAIGLAGVVDFNSTVNLSCSGPSNYVKSCTVTPASMTLSGVKSASATLVLQSNAPKNSSFTVTFTAVAPANAVSAQSTRSSPALVKVPK